MEFTEPGTIDDLVEDAARAGYSVTPRLVHDWVSKGLLDRPKRRRTGRTGSEKGLYDDFQRSLFLAELKTRSAQPRISEIAQLPLMTWMFDGHLVPTRQALRAILTYVGDPRGSKQQALQQARRLIEPLSDPRLGTTRNRRELLYAVRDTFYVGHCNRDLLLAKAAPLFEPRDLYLEVSYSRGRSFWDSAEGYLFELECRVAAGRFVASGSLTTEIMENARGNWRIILGHLTEAELVPLAVSGLMNMLGMFALDSTIIGREPKSPLSWPRSKRPADATKDRDQLGEGKEKAVLNLMAARMWGGHFA
ncbi:hypothetical protein [Catenulispora sp. MAP12-49]|uniref:hypothetical protein n=1 Tax=Catenulispora sp. MAP12-49 TaxID=3156302 RepID=UPI00351848D0